ncbi:MAG: membrane dipeptidase [Clostridia bacterium]|nr:membrane dipeptidase [Clostridia bacterium]
MNFTKEFERTFGTGLSALGIFDAHCDTLTEFDPGRSSLFDSKTHFNVERQLEYGRYVQVMDIWVDRARHDPEARTQHYLKEFERQLEVLREKGKSGETDGAGFGVSFIKSREDLKEYYDPKGGKCAGFILGIEGGECIDSDAEPFYSGNAEFRMLNGLYAAGVRLITVTWNTPNAMSDTNCAANEKPGLTDFGKAAVLEMNRLGIMIDVSHLSDKGFEDVAEMSKKPFIASHSDSRVLCGHSRNLTDDMFKTLISAGGVTGINFCRDFLGGSADIDRILEHIEHFASLGGVANIGIGSDFDGIGRLPGGIEGAQSLYKIIDGLLKLNYTEAQVRGIAADNFRRVFEEVLPPRSRLI